jgi:uncharacterized membrane protein YebE (DUF533 family)
MNAQGLLDQLLRSGRELTEKGQNLAEQKLGIPKEGPDRDAALSNLGKGAAMAGTLAVLLGTRAGRAVGGAAVKLGSLAAIGGLAYKTYQDWQGKQGQAAAEPAAPAGQLAGQQAEQRSRVLLKAMIAAAKADGHIDEAESGKIDKHLEQLGLDRDTLHFVKAELAKPLDVKDVAAAADSPETAAEMYLTSLLAIDIDSEQEKHYLSELAAALKLAPALVTALENRAKA